MSLANVRRPPGIVTLAALLGLAAIGAQQRPPAQPTKPAPPATVPASQAQPKARTPAERPVPFRVGETLEYDVSWSALLTAGSAVLKVEEKKASYGSRAYYISAEGRPIPLIASLYPVYYKADTLLDVFTLLSQRGSLYSDERGEKKTQVTVFDRRAGSAVYEIQGAPGTKTELVVPPLSQDVLSAVYALRASPLLEGGQLTVPIVDRGAMHTARVSVGGKEQIPTGAGVFRAWRITPVLADSDGREEYSGLVLWISDDHRRLPVRLEAELAVGRFVLLLRRIGKGLQPVV